jgi:GNAT superfamily N-acetyltransferase
MDFYIEERPCADTIQEVVAIAQSYTVDFFTPNVPADTKNDLQFQRVAYVKEGRDILAFAVFTCLDGCPHITLLATRRAYRGSGYGKRVMEGLIQYLDALGFHALEVMTVPPASKPVYASTVAFYRAMGFEEVACYPDLWESGAIKLRLRW